LTLSEKKPVRGNDRVAYGREAESAAGVDNRVWGKGEGSQNGKVSKKKTEEKKRVE